MKFSLLLLSFIGLVAANQEMYEGPPEGRCNAVFGCPLKKKYRNAKLTQEQLEDKKYYQCCSYYSYCGETDEYCGVGCQNGDCNPEYKIQNQRLYICNTYYKLGKCDEDCPCPDGSCCSKYGYCGTGEDYCGVNSLKPTTTTTKKANTTKSSSVKLTTITTTKDKSKTKSTTTKKATPTTTNKKDGECGEGYGNCPPGECCSKYGWCGTSDDYCNVDKGCQKAFGQCGNVNSIKTTNKSKAKTSVKTKKVVVKTSVKVITVKKNAKSKTNN